MRIIENVRPKKQIKKHIFIPLVKLKKATDVRVRQQQRKVYSEEIESLNGGYSVRTESKILKLYPFLHMEILHVGG